MHELSTVHIREIRETNELFMKKDHWGSLFEYVTTLIYYAALRPHDVAVDCGVNVGDHCRLLARLCSPGQVFGFEAAPEMLERARQATSEFDNVELSGEALWSEAGLTKTFHFFPEEHGLSGFFFREGVTGEFVHNVQTTTLDEAVPSSPALIKLDIEGAEYHALLGAERIMREAKPILVFENGRQDSAQRFGYTKDDFFSLFYERDYSIYSISGVPFVPQIWEDVSCPWQFIATHRASVRTGRVLGAVSSFVNSIR